MLRVLWYSNLVSERASDPSLSERQVKMADHAMDRQRRWVDLAGGQAMTCACAQQNVPHALLDGGRNIKQIHHDALSQSWICEVHQFGWIRSALGDRWGVIRTHALTSPRRETIRKFFPTLPLPIESSPFGYLLFGIITFWFICIDSGLLPE